MLYIKYIIIDWLYKYRNFNIFYCSDVVSYHFNFIVNNLSIQSFYSIYWLIRFSFILINMNINMNKIMNIIINNINRIIIYKKWQLTIVSSIVDMFNILTTIIPLLIWFQSLHIINISIYTHHWNKQLIRKRNINIFD